MEQTHGAIAILPCNDLGAAQAFYERLGFDLQSDFPHHGYKILANAAGASIHLTAAPPGWVVPDRNPFGVYLYSQDVDALAARFDMIAETKPWGMREFAVSDPNGTLVRIGWPVDD